MGREIERKFLVNSLPPGWKKRRRWKIDQGYLSRGSSEVSIRLRKIASEHLLTVKTGRGLKRVEEEIDIPKSSFEALWPLSQSARISKTRYRIPLNEDVAELDIYQGKHRGLAVVEIEFDSGRASRSFEPPDWFGREVTNDRRYANESLARAGKRPGS